MKLVDANVLLYAVNEDSPHHGKASVWLNSTLSSTETVALTWSVLLAFLRLSTRAVVFPVPLTPGQALDVIDSWLEQPNVTIAHPGERHASVLGELIRASGTAGNLTTDAHLAAIAIEHGAELVSCDGDFARFSGVRWIHPFA